MPPEDDSGTDSEDENVPQDGPDPEDSDAGTHTKAGVAEMAAAAVVRRRRGGSDSADDIEGSEQPEDPAAEAAAAGLDRNRVVAAAAVVAVLALLGWLLFVRSDEPANAPTTTVTSAAPAPSTDPQVRPALVSQVATAKPDVSTVVVDQQPPIGWDTMGPAVMWEAPELPASQEEFDRAALPREDYRIEGRYKTPTGWEFSNPTPFDQPFTMLVTEQRGDWAEVLMPVRPNGTRGYIDTSQVDLSQHDYRVELDLSDRQLVAYQGNDVIMDTLVVIGKDATRTPTGRFYVTDKTDETPSSFYGSHMLPLNGYSEQLDRFGEDDGVPVIAMHGTSDPSLIGQAESNGCVRMPNEVVELLYDQLPVGTQVEIRA
ncbi:MAG: L,D-transpeptidase [Actinomycetia bacterium]|nr:L,D-transpeptidase [Actinomycetes bacterium]